MYVHRSVNSPNGGKKNLPGSWANSQKNCSFKLCKVLDQTPEICLQISCCFCLRVPQKLSTTCAQSRKVCQLLSVQRSSPVKQGQHLAPHNPLQFGAGAGEAWENVIIDAVLVTIFEHLTSSRHWLEPLITIEEGGMPIIFIVQRETHAQIGYFTYQRSHSKEVAEVEFELNSEPTTYLLSTMPTLGGSEPEDNWENGRTGVYNLRKTVYHLCMHLLLGALLY